MAASRCCTGRKGAFVIIHVMRFDGTGVEDDYIMWGYAASHDKFPDMRGMSQERAQAGRARA